MAKIVQLKSIVPQPIYIDDFSRANEKGTIRGSMSIIGGAIEKGKTRIEGGRIIISNEDGVDTILIGKK